MKSILRYLFPLILLLSLCGASYAKDTKHFLYVGTYTNGDSKGIYAYSYDATTGAAQTNASTAPISSGSISSTQIRRSSSGRG